LKSILVNKKKKLTKYDMKRPFEFVMDNFFESLDKVKENQRYNFNNSERFMIWIVGFSIGGLSIIVTNLAQFTNSFDYREVL